jgi:hypothetical protein
VFAISPAVGLAAIVHQESASDELEIVAYGKIKYVFDWLPTVK